MEAKRIVITGIGVISPVGLDVDTMWQNLVAGRSGILRFPFWRFFLLCWLGRTILYIGAVFAGAWGWEAVLRLLG